MFVLLMNISLFFLYIKLFNLKLTKLKKYEILSKNQNFCKNAKSMSNLRWTKSSKFLSFY